MLHRRASRHALRGTDLHLSPGPGSPSAVGARPVSSTDDDGCGPLSFFFAAGAGNVSDGDSVAYASRSSALRGFALTNTIMVIILVIITATCGSRVPKVRS